MAHTGYFPVDDKTPYENQYESYSGDAAPQWQHGHRVSGGDTSSRILKGALAGAVAGLAAGYVMTLFQKGWSKAEKEIKRSGRDRKNVRQGVPEHRESHKQEQGDDATIKMASAITEIIFDHKLTKKEKKVAGPVVHYMFAAVMGAIYGTAVAAFPSSKAGFGTAFGTGLFIGADEIAVPALGMADGPGGVPLSKHFYGWVSHLVYGVSTEAVRRPLHAALDKI